MVITQNGVAKVIVQDIREYEKTKDTLALLKMLSMISKNIRDGSFKSFEQTFIDIDNRIHSNQG